MDSVFDSTDYGFVDNVWFGMMNTHLNACGLLNVAALCNPDARLIIDAPYFDVFTSFPN